ncbi:MAG: TIGR00268 family protein, partial [Blautia sp.]|nr:TIGR00268 family protein [Blautia sp.]
MSQSYSPTPLTPEQSEKYQNLLALLKSFGSVAIAFSGGVDSCLLLEAAHTALPGKVIAVTASSSSFPERERQEAKQFCEDRGIPQFITKTQELSIEGFAQNPPNRCY